jgi:hypothetical protein
MSAGVTPIEMAAEGGRATARDRAEYRSLLHAQPRMLRDEGVALRVEDIGHLHRRPAHAGLGGSIPSLLSDRTGQNVAIPVA